MTPQKPHPHAKLAAIVRGCTTKKELQAAGLRGERLNTAWAWLQIRHARYKAREEIIKDNCRYSAGMSYYMPPRQLHGDDYRLKFITPEFRSQIQEWPWADTFGYSWKCRLAYRLLKTWPYRWQDKKYHLSLRHSRANAVEVDGRRSASRYDTFFVTLKFNLLTHEAVVIGGLLTIRAKADALNASYPCIWLERNKTGPGLSAIQGRIIDHNHHIVEDLTVLGKKAATQLKRRLSRLKSVPPPGSP